MPAILSARRDVAAAAEDACDDVSIRCCGRVPKERDQSSNAVTLGIIDIGIVPPHDARHDFELWGTDDLPFLSRYDGLVCVRVTALGAWCLGIADAYVAPSYKGREIVEVLSSLRVLPVPGAAIPTADRLMLDSIADGDGESWRLSRPRLLDAVERGRTTQELAAFLHERSDQDLPPSVEALLADVDVRSRAMTGPDDAKVFVCVDGALADRISEAVGVRMGVLRAGDRHVVVPAPKESAVRRKVHQLGYGIAVGDRATIS